MNAKKTRQAVVSVFVLLTFGLGPMGAAHAAVEGSSLKDVKKEVAEAAEAIKHYSADQRDEALDKAKSAMESLNAEIDRLRASIDDKWSKMDKAARHKARAALDGLQEQRRRMAESYAALKESSADTWGHVRKGFSDSFEDLHEAWQKAEKEFDDGK